MKLNLSRAKRIYAFILRLYPAGHRREFGPLMAQTFADSYHDTLQTQGNVGLEFWFSTIEDEIKSLGREHMSAIRENLNLKTCIYGIIIGLLLMVSLVWSNLLFPTFESDDEYAGQYFLLYIGIFLYFALSGFLASRKTRKISDGARVGAITALIAIAIVTVTIFVVDNAFLDIVSKQPDKISGFQHSNFASMRDYVNAGILRGILIVPIVFAVIGAAFGAFGAWLGGLRPTILSRE